MTKKYFGTDGIRGAINSKNINGDMFFKFLKYVPAAKPNLKNFSPLIFPTLTVPLIPSVPKYFFFIYLLIF